ncbi:MAG TPA: hypothetical protein VFN92_09105 [Solirubrobacterales bacterium]|nr:hypothetical protein [Solirubrobacterales bacterium]
MAARDTQPFSARWRVDVLDRSRERSEFTETNKSRLAERYVDEGTRMDDHPGIVFRDGPAGRRAALASGPDVWELMATLKAGKAKGERAIAATAELLDLTDLQVRTGVRYYASFKEEIDQRIALHAEDADEAEAAWKREQAALG